MRQLIPAVFPFRIDLSGVQLDCCFSFSDTARYFHSYLIGPCSNFDGIHVPKEEWDFWISQGGVQDSLSEFSCFTACASDALLYYDRAIFHGVSFSFHGRAWLICADSGVGKSTQIRSLQKLFPGEFSVICGDRTVLELMNGDAVMAHPSPWNGKEGWRGADAAPLAGILCLERSERTEIHRLHPRDAVFPVLKHMISTYMDVDIIHHLATFENSLLSRVPVWRYCNGGVPDSCKYLYENLLRLEA